MKKYLPCSTITDAKKKKTTEKSSRPICLSVSPHVNRRSDNEQEMSLVPHFREQMGTPGPRRSKGEPRIRSPQVTLMDLREEGDVGGRGGGRTSVLPP